MMKAFDIKFGILQEDIRILTRKRSDGMIFSWRRSQH